MMGGMPAWARALMWAFILLVCAGIGAFVASRSNPFPPGVRDPGAQPGAPTSPGPAVDEVTPWTITMTSRSTHTFRVGGSCRSDWRMRGRISVGEGGRVSGSGVARLLPGSGCDFPSAQVQSARVHVGIVGTRDGGALDLRFRERGLEPAGSQDLGGFVKVLPALRVSIRERAAAEASTPKRIEDPEDEIYAAVTLIRLAR
jgi:hypothetical protein